MQIKLNIFNKPFSYLFLFFYNDFLKRNILWLYSFNNFIILFITTLLEMNKWYNEFYYTITDIMNFTITDLK